MIDGPEMRAAFSRSRRPPQWGYRVFPGEALRLKFVAGGVELPSEPAHDLAGTPSDAGIIPRPSRDRAANQAPRAAFARVNSSLTDASRSWSTIRSMPVSAIARATASVLA